METVGFDGNGECMQKVIIWYGLLLKRNTKQITAWLMTAALLLLLLVVQGIHMPSGKTMTIGLYFEQDGSMERALCEDLENSHSRFAFVNYQDKEQMYKEVQSGKLECGFLMQSDFTERVRQDNWKKCVTYIANPFTTKGEVAKETFFAAFFKEYSGKLLAQSEKEIFTTQDQKRLEKMQKSSDDFLQSVFFYTDIVPVDTKVKKVQDNHDAYPVQGIFAVFLLGIMYFANAKRYEPKGIWVQHAFPNRERFLFACVQELAAVTIPAVVGFVLLLFVPQSRGLGQELLSFVIFLVYAIIWTTLYAKIPSSTEGFLAYGIVMMAIAVIMCPVFWDVGAYIPVMRYLKYLIPVGVYV